MIRSWLLERPQGRHAVEDPATKSAFRLNRTEHMTVRNIISSRQADVITADEHDVFLTLVERLNSHKIGALVVVDLTGRLLGIITEHDLVRVLAKNSAAAFALSARDLMTTKVASCTPDDTESHVMLQMVEKHISHMPVVMEGRVVGLVSLSDVIEHRLRKLGHRLDNGGVAPTLESIGGSFSRHLGSKPR